MTTLTKSAVTAYAEAVLAGGVPAGKLVVLACERHQQDLSRDDIYFDEDAADRAINFFSLLRHNKGEWAGDPLHLEPWQQFIIGSIFGWKQADGLRRFRTAYTELGRKNGKSTIAAGVGLYLAFFDGEGGAEVYCAATKRDQARIVFDEAKQTVLKTPSLRKYITPLVGNLHSTATGSKFEPLGADKDGMDGLNIHGLIIDELHAHKGREMWDVLRTATGARRQPLIFVITTAGWDRNSICWQQHDYGVKILEQVVEDDAYFAYIATTDEGDDWQDEDTWIKANPNLGISVKLDTLRTECQEAQQMPGQQNAFRRLRLCQWTEGAERWIDLGLWDSCGTELVESELEGRPCYAGLDLASVSDLASLALVFPAEDEPWQCLIYNWLPEEAMRQRERRDRVPYPQWVAEGHITATEGDVIDYDVIRRDINALGRRYQIREIAIDRWNSTQLQTQLGGDGFTVVPFGQGFASMSAPTKELERRILNGTMAHGNNPVLRWAASNVVVTQDAAGNLKPAKDKSTEKIDPIVALVMGIGRAMVHDTHGRSYYADHDLLVL